MKSPFGQLADVYKRQVYDITTFTVDGKTLDSYEADIDTDPDYTPDHEVVSDGYFHESDVDVYKRQILLLNSF